MKAKHIYTLFALLSAAPAKAQFTKGSTLLGGNIGFSNISPADGGSNATTVAAGLSWGRVVKDNTVNGFAVSFGLNTQPSTSYDPSTGITRYRTESQLWSAGVFKRRYLPLGKNFYFFGQGGADLIYGRNWYTQSTPSGPISSGNSKLYSISASLHPGLSYQFSRRFLLELSLPPLVSAGFSHNTAAPGNMKTNTVFLNSNLNLSSLSNIQVGFRLLLPAKKPAARA